MGRRLILTPQKLEQIRALRGRGLTREQIAREAGCSTGLVSKALGMGKAKAKAVLAEVMATHDTPATEEDAVPLTVADQRVELSKLFRSQAKLACDKRESNPAEANTAARLATALSAALARVTVPDPPRDPNEHPDMVAAAERGRAKLWEYLERIQTGK